MIMRLYNFGVGLGVLFCKVLGSLTGPIWGKERDTKPDPNSWSRFFFWGGVPQSTEHMHSSNQKNCFMRYGVPDTESQAITRKHPDPKVLNAPAPRQSALRPLASELTLSAHPVLPGSRCIVNLGLWQESGVC